MKLYTEEQVRKAYFKGASDCHDKCINRNWRGVELAVDVKLLEELNNEYMDFQTPIELPTWDDVRKAIAMGFDWCHNKQIPQDWMINKFVEQLKNREVKSE